jgi:peptidyl-prolyl cis-trans isomerase C
MTLRLFGFGVLFLSMGLLSACNSSSENSTLATINGREIQANEFSAYLRFKRIPEQDESRKTRALDILIEREALAQQIAQSGELDQQLVQAELDEFRRQMLISRYFENYLKDAVTDESIANFYSTHADRYQSESVHVAHILIRVSPEMGEVERQAKLSTAHEAYSKLQQGQPFDEVAAAYSEDRLSAEKGGDLGWLQQGAVGPTFSKTVFDLEAGSVSEPFLTPFGFHIVKVIEGPQTVTKPLEAVEGDIRYELRNEAKKAERERLLNSAEIEKVDA